MNHGECCNCFGCKVLKAFGFIKECKSGSKECCKTETKKVVKKSAKKKTVKKVAKKK